MILSVLQNIISKVIKHSKKDEKINIIATNADDKIIVEIRDSGVGMSIEMQKKLFTPQMNKLAEAREENKGAGIGLLLVKGFLEKNGGDIWVKSKEGEGTSFYFSLPINKPTEKTIDEKEVHFNKLDLAVPLTDERLK